MFLYCRASPLIGYILAASTGLLLAMEITLAKYYPEYLSDRNIFIVLFWTYTFGTVISLLVMVIFEDPQIPIGFEEYFFTSCHIFSYIFLMPLLMYGSSVTSGNTANILSTSPIIAMLAAQYTISTHGVFIVLLGATISSILELCQSYKSSKN